MSRVAAACGLSVLGGLGGLLIAAGFLLLSEPVRARLVPSLVSYAVGTMLGVALLAMLPQALVTLVPVRVFATLLSGIVLFFVLEKLVVWHHCHTNECEVPHHHIAAPVVLIGDTIHNFVDGALIGAAVVTSIPLAISTAIAVAAHEIPHKVSDFAVLLHAGYSRERTLLLSTLSGLAGIVGALAAVLTLNVLPTLLPYALAIASASFLYVAMADLMPGLHQTPPGFNSLRQIVLVGLGVATVLVL